MTSTQLKPAIRESDHHRGPLAAPIQLVEYGDFECGYCGLAFPQIERFVKEFSDQVCFAFRNFPLSNIHPHAMLAAMAAEAAGRQNNFWPMHHLLFQNQESLSEQSILYFAQILRLDMAEFKRDLSAPELENHIQSDFMSGVRSGVNGTPTLFLNGYRFNAGADYELLSQSARRILVGHRPDSQWIL
jgi:protein-disulfide isomerase